MFHFADREYLYHPAADKAGTSMPLANAVRSFAANVLEGTHRWQQSELSVQSNLDTRLDIRLMGERLDLNTVVAAWGLTYEITMSAADTEAFTSQESWLQSPPKVRDAWCELPTATSDEEPTRIPQPCPHPPTRCSTCIARWQQQPIVGREWNNVTCPDCAPPMQEGDDSG